MEILLLVALLRAMGANKPQTLLDALARLESGDADALWQSEPFRSVRIFGMTPPELLSAAAKLRTLAAALAPPAAEPAAAPAAEKTEAAKTEEKNAFAPVAGIANEEIERMLGKYFA